MAQIVPFRGTNIVGGTKIAFSFVSNGSNAIDQTTIRGTGVTSVTKNATTGRIDVVLDNAFYRIVSARGGVFATSATTGPATTDVTHVVLGFADETSSPLSFTVWTIKGDGTAVNTTAAQRIWVELTIQASAGA